MWTTMLAPAGSVKVPLVLGAAPQLSVWLGAVPPIVQAIPLGIELPPLSIDQLTPLFAMLGSGSLKVVPVESPGPPLLKVTLNPIGLPALTGAESSGVL